MTRMEFNLQYYKEEIAEIHRQLDAIDPYTDDPDLQRKIEELGQLECEYSFEVHLLSRLLEKPY